MELERTRLTTAVRECRARPNVPVEDVCAEVWIAWETRRLQKRARKDSRYMVCWVKNALASPPMPRPATPLLDGIDKKGEPNG